MTDKVSMILSLFLLAACVGRGGTPDDDIVEPATPVDLGEAPIEEIAAELARLRTTKGHFEGGTWNDDVDRWMGRKHQLLIQLGTRLGTGEYSRAEIVRLLDSPDQIAREGDELFGLVSSLPGFERPAAGPYDLLIYYWRGQHDFLYLTSQAETIVNSGWWYAGE